MRIARVRIDGYGRFEDVEIDLEPGLQVIAGPNEQGKSTLRDFITDALYGQKRSTTQRLYAPNHELRRPWRNSGKYGGALVYVLDNQHVIEVSRVFDRKQESVQVYDRSLARDITREFPMLRNGEPAFAEEQLGMSKDLFLNAATISYLNLTDLGQDNALAQIRDRLLTLTDTADESHSAESALAWIRDRIAAIGRPNARSRPLPSARARLDQVTRELEAARAARRETEDLELRKQAIRSRIESLRSQREKREQERAAVDRLERAARLKEAERVQQEIDEVTHSCFAMSSVRDFPLNREPELQRMLNALNTARIQLERSEAEHAELLRQADAERSRLGSTADLAPAEEPEGTERRLAELEASTARLAERIEQLEEEIEAARRRIEAAQAELARLPDFATLPPEPIEWLNQAASAYESRRQAREQEHRALAALQARIEDCRNRLARPHEVFRNFPHFRAEAEEYKLAIRLHEDRRSQLSASADQYRVAADGKKEERPHFRNLTIVFTAATAGFVLAAYLSENWGVYLPAALLGLVAAYFLVHWVSAVIGASTARRALETIERELTTIAEETRQKRQRLDQLIAAAACQSIRELEALYERYVFDRQQLAAFQTEHAALSNRVEQARQDAAAAFAELRNRLALLGIDVPKEEAVPDAIRAAISHYHEYREAKRREQESCDLLTQLEALAKQTRRDLDTTRAEDRALSLEVRQRMRNGGFREEARYSSALKALRAYRDWSTQIRERRGRLRWLEEQIATLNQQIETEKATSTKQQAALAAFLKECGAESPDHWKQLAEDARRYQKKWDQRVALLDKLDALLRGETIEALRASVQEVDPDAEHPQRSSQELLDEIARLDEMVDSHINEEHAIDIRIAECAAGVRSLNEIEEEQEALTHQIQELELEMEAAEHAAALIEEVADERHGRIAPQLAAAASRYFAEITGGAYSELLISCNLVISVRIPQTGILKEKPEPLLSKGAVDQLYLALRLALVDCLSRTGERVPLLLDDPFGNYDQNRLAQAIGLLRRLAESRQILLFTCHDHVARIARAAGASVLTL